MVDLILLIGLALFMLFAFVVVRGAPYLPTLQPQLQDALDMLDLKKGQTLLELGSGDGRMLRAAAERGIYAVGYELNPILVLWTKLRHWRYRGYITVHWADFWTAEWQQSDAMYVFLLQKYMSKLDKKIVQYTQGRPYTLVSFSFKITDKKPVMTKKGLYMYAYPAATSNR